jgi:hypothetical protein
MEQLFKGNQDLEKLLCARKLGFGVLSRRRKHTKKRKQEEVHRKLQGLSNKDGKNHHTSIDDALEGKRKTNRFLKMRGSRSLPQQAILWTHFQETQTQS